MPDPASMPAEKRTSTKAASPVLPPKCPKVIIGNNAASGENAKAKTNPHQRRANSPLYLSTTAPARTPNKAIGRKPANDARERREDDPVVRAICQMRPIWRIELVNVDTSSPPHTKQILNCHEWHSETDLRREVSNIMVMSNRGMACKTARRHNSAAFRRSSTCGKDQPRHPSFADSVRQTTQF